MLHAARALGRPVKWTDARSDSFLSDSHGRDHDMTGELALDKDGKFLAVRMTGYGNVGAYLSNATTLPQTMNTVKNVIGVYATPLVEVAAAACSPTPPRSARIAAPGGRRATTTWSAWSTRPRRKWGSTGSSCAGATTSGRSRCPTPRHRPWSYDSGDFPALLEKALDAADWDGFAARRAEQPAPGQAAAASASATTWK